MNHIQIKYVNKTPRSMKFVNGLIGKLDSRKHQVSTESQQLSSVGMMPDPNYQVIDVTQMTIAQAIRVYEDAKNHMGKSSKYVLLKDEDTESVQTRMDRDALEKGLKDLGYEVFTEEVDVTDDIQSKYNELSIKVNDGETNA